MSTRTVKASMGTFLCNRIDGRHQHAFPIPALTQDKPADNMQILREKIKADKKLACGNQHGTDGVGGKGVSGPSTRSIRRI